MAITRCSGPAQVYDLWISIEMASEQEQACCAEGATLRTLSPSHVDWRTAQATRARALANVRSDRCDPEHKPRVLAARAEDDCAGVHSISRQVRQVATDRAAVAYL
jgi:hypothetical protein